LTESSVLVVTGGIGGAKLCLGFQRILPRDSLRIVVNTGDDFEHLGLYICPDIDTTLYTLSGLANTELGWGRQNETWTFMEALGSLGGETWFRLGDGDLALHVERTRRLRAGDTLTEFTQDVARRLGLNAAIFPASDHPVRTMVTTAEGRLGFQDYFVGRRCMPVVKTLDFLGAGSAKVSPQLLKAFNDPALRAIVIAPSNPYLSIDPILAISDMRALMRRAGVPIIAVTPIIGGQAVKGPTAKIMKELGIDPSPVAIVDHYRGLIDGFVLDARDEALASEIGMPTRICDTLMLTLGDRDQVARAVLELVDTLQ
jgi:LPPG:FO 2-phospho-L-lactate transferase